ncbi:hypothetical protein PMAYCL1PPCAC_27789, partial [Pristionchus mayeri]
HSTSTGSPSSLLLLLSTSSVMGGFRIGAIVMSGVHIFVSLLEIILSAALLIASMGIWAWLPGIFSLILAIGGLVVV